MKVKYLILENGMTIERRDLGRWGSSLFDLKSRKVSGSSMGCHKFVAAWVIASVCCVKSDRKDRDISCKFISQFAARILWIFGNISDVTSLSGYKWNFSEKIIYTFFHKFKLSVVIIYITVICNICKYTMFIKFVINIYYFIF